MNSKLLSRRQFLQATAGIAGIAALAACAPVAAPQGGGSAPAATGAAMQFWTETFNDWATKQNKAYEQAHAGVKIEMVSFKWGEMMPKLLTASAGGTAPNMIIQDRFRMAGWAARGGATALDDLVQKAGIKSDDFWPATWAEGNWQGKIYSIPFNTDGRFIFWNKDILSKAGLDPEAAPPTKDWTAMIDLAGKLTQKGSDGKVQVMGYVPYESTGYGNGGDYVYAWANGGEFMKDDKTAWMDNPKLVETLQWQSDVVKAIGGIKTAADFSAGWPSTAGFSPFGAGQIAMMVNGDWNLSDFKKYYPDLKFGMAPFHVRNDDQKVTGFAGGFCVAIPAGSKNVDASFALLQSYVAKDAQLDLGISNQVIPALKAAALDDKLINSSPYPTLRRTANESMQYARFRPITPVGQQIQDMWTSPGTGRDWVLYGQKTPEQACADMQTQVQKALDEFWATVKQG